MGIDYTKLEFGKILKDSLFPVYLIKADGFKNVFALKLFPYENGKTSKFYRREMKLARMDHPHIISVFETSKYINMTINGKTQDYSGILMEHCSNGNMFDTVVEGRLFKRDKIIRGYFH